MLINNSEYFSILEEIKSQIRTAQYRAVVGANRELLTLYWNIGNIILENKRWGNKFVENLSRDIKADFPNVTGYSVRNLKYMQKFASTYNDLEFVQSVTAQIPWTHNKSILDKVKDRGQMEWYILKTAENNWSVGVLEHQLESHLYQRQISASKTTNYPARLDMAQSELAVQTLKDPYWFDFIEAKDQMVERDIENEMVSNISKLLLELGTGFAFLGNQYHLEVGGEDFYIDLLFYNTNLHCYFVIELKAGMFKPEYAGKLNFYLSAVDELLKKEKDNPSIGLILCRNKNKTIAEYALKDMTKPIGVSEYKLTEYLPKEFEDTLPSIEDIEKRVKSKYNLSEQE
ncbi:MAG: PDDEXK nuclease domain-containing protein [Methanosarcinales archaeon]|nr:PDDEXK nuclease domain-containing protein [Methanosarcinales archaeon]